MESDGIVDRKDYQEVPPKVEYALTRFGISLKEALTPLCEWGSTHMKHIEATRAPVEMTSPGPTVLETQALSALWGSGIVIIGIVPTASPA